MFIMMAERSCQKNFLSVGFGLPWPRRRSDSLYYDNQWLSGEMDGD